MEVGRISGQVSYSKQHFDQFLNNLNNCVNIFTTFSTHTLFGGFGIGHELISGACRNNGYRQCIRRYTRTLYTNLTNPNILTRIQLSDDSSSERESRVRAMDSNTGTTAANAVPFVLMVRGGKGGKQQFKQFVAPSDSQFAINLKLQEDKTSEEKEKVKRLTLNITERIEEEDYQESLVQSQRSLSQNHYQRPSTKGAPKVVKDALFEIFKLLGKEKFESDFRA